MAPYALAVPRDATEKSAPDERGTDVPVRVIPLPDEERKRVNAQFLEAKRRFEAYQNDPSQLQLLSDAHAILLEMNTRYSDAFRRRGIFDAVYEQVRDALDALLPW